MTNSSMTALNKQALRQSAEKAQEHGVFNMDIHSQTVLALLDELEAAENRIAEVESQRRMSFMACNRWADKFREAEKRIAELERKEQHSERQSVIDALAGSGEEWSDIEEYMQKWDAERAAAAGKGEAS